MGIEAMQAEELKELGEFSKKLAEFWRSEEGDVLRKLMAEFTEGYMGEIMQGDQHAFRAVRAINDCRKCGSKE